MDDLFLWRLAECGRIMRHDMVNDFDVLLLMSPPGMSYFTGNDRPWSYVMVTRFGAAGIGVPETDLAEVTASSTFDHIKSFVDREGMLRTMSEYYEFFKAGSGSLGLEFARITPVVKEVLTAPGVLPPGMEVRDCSPLVYRLRSVKDAAEMKLIREAAAVAGTGMAAAAAAIEPGVTESQVAAQAELAMEESGAEGFLQVQVVSGPRTQFALGRPTARVLQDGDLVTVCLYPSVGSYSAGICRTFCLGSPLAEQARAHDAYLKAQKEAIAAAIAGATAGGLDRRFYESLRSGAPSLLSFGPAVHGVGLETVEAPVAGAHSLFDAPGSAEPFKPNTVLVLGGCGLYAGQWGLRIEDTVAVAEGEPELLTGYPYSLKLG